jgi:hypothetical protein
MLRAFLVGASAGFVGAACVAGETVARDPEASWWRGNLHTHSLWSDGDDFPEMISEWYRDNGYHFLAMSDHNTMNSGMRWMPVSQVQTRSRDLAMGKYLGRFGESWVETRGEPGTEGHEVRLKPLSEYRSLVEERGRFMLFEAEEITGEVGDGRAIHMNATNLPFGLQPAEAPTVREMILRNMQAVERVAAETGRDVLVHVNHPNYKWGVTAEDLAAVAEERFFEVWNGVDGDQDPGDEHHPSNEEIWDIANTLRLAKHGVAPLLGLATDDSHDYHQTTVRAMPGRAWVMVRATHLTPETIIRALRAGDFYSTSGVELESLKYEPEIGRMSLKIRGREGAKYTTRFVGARRGIELGGVARTDAEGREVQTTLDYSGSRAGVVGEVFAEVEGLEPTYTLKGDEWYVRAVIVSDVVPVYPSRESLVEKAWIQPFGWERWVAAGPAEGD